MTNPLLEFQGLPPFSNILPEHIEPAIDKLLHESKQQIDDLVDNCTNVSWETFIQPLEDIQDRINKTWSPVSHLNAVVNNEALRNAYNTCLSKLSEFHTELAQNKAIYQAYHDIKTSNELKL